MLDLLKRYQKMISLGGGALMVVIGLAMLFWYKPSSGISLEEARAQANVARMEARVAGKSSVAPEKSSPSAIMASYKERQERNVRYTVIALMIGGIAFLLYGFIKKEEE